MIKVTAAEFQRNIGRYQDIALTQPVVVARNGRERTVMISVEEYYPPQAARPPGDGAGGFYGRGYRRPEETRAPEAAKAFDNELKSS